MAEWCWKLGTEIAGLSLREAEHTKGKKRLEAERPKDGKTQAGRQLPGRSPVNMIFFFERKMIWEIFGEVVLLCKRVDRKGVRTICMVGDTDVRVRCLKKCLKEQ